MLFSLPVPRDGIHDFGTGWDVEMKQVIAHWRVHLLILEGEIKEGLIAAGDLKFSD
jgi:hypothetical protein